MDLSTDYLGLSLKNPLVVGASPLTAEPDGCRQLEDAGAAALVLPSLFQEQIIRESEEFTTRMTEGTESFPEALTYFPDFDDTYIGPQSYLEHIRAVKEAVDIPVIASLNGITTGGWTDYSRLMQEAGADALELNIYFLPTDPTMSAGAVEELYLGVLAETKLTTSIPIAVKLSPWFSAIANLATRIDEEGADGLVLFNRFYQPTINLETLEVEPDLVLSTPFASRLPLRWIALLSSHISASLAATSGVHSHEDVLRLLLAGADAVQLVAVLMQNGTAGLTPILKDMQAWMEEKEYDSVAQLKGSLNAATVADPAAFERANYMKTLHSW